MTVNKDDFGISQLNIHGRNSFRVLSCGNSLYIDYTPEGRREQDGLFEKERGKELHEIHVYEYKYITDVDSKVTVIFSLTGKDWEELRNLPCWKEVKTFLEELRQHHNSMT